jgi:hypothetical protein
MKAVVPTGANATLTGNHHSIPIVVTMSGGLAGSLLMPGIL